MMDSPDKGEVLDLVERKGPLSFPVLMNQISAYSEDAVYVALKALVHDGQVNLRDGDLEADGTTRDVYEAAADGGGE